MKVYSKIRNASFPKSRSVDFSDLDSPLQTPKFISNNSKNQEMAQNQISRTLTHVSFPVQEVHEDGSGEIFGVILSRTCSVSSASSKAVRAEKLQKDSSLERAVRRALSMSRSTSVSEGYRRMHHQCDPLVDDDSSATHARRSKNKRSALSETENTPQFQYYYMAVLDFFDGEVSKVSVSSFECIPHRWVKY
ncbi:uncharacterized protein LOC122316863 isoform X1 [Carya illinoinensis]|uniref:uncharacterized protein LOC122316863 isoform X1 n=1 Tax=Carya illinoinensis TaxID=32201 RepID=UPI001C71DD94|nr:uncharacterized protein LOC122316863 isoform X1 [Carya illinoinensis]